MNSKLVPTLIGIAAGLALAIVLWIGVRAASGQSAPPAQPQSNADDVYPLSFQGRLTSHGHPVVNPVSVTFSIYDAKVGSTPIFTEVQTIDPDENGLFNTALHVDPPLGVSSLTNVWVGVRVGNDSEMLPRMQMSGVGYAFTLVPGAGIRGMLYMTDTTNAMFSAINLADGIGVRGYSQQGTGVHASSTDGYALEADGDVRVTGQYTGTFPSPAWDSGWQAISPGAVITLSHNVGGDSADNYVVDLYCKDAVASGRGIHQISYGGNATTGVFWQRLTTASIQVQRLSNDTFCDEARVRIWVYK